MKKLLWIVVLGMFISGCSENETKISKLIETCADNKLYKTFERGFKNANVGSWKIIEPEVKRIIETDLNTKLHKYQNFTFIRDHSYGTSRVRFRYDNYFEKCETSQKLHPIKFKEKYLNYKIPYKNYNF